MPRDVPGRDRERRLGAIDSEDVCLGELVSECDGDAAGAGADVDDSKAAVPPSSPKGLFDDELGLGPRDQHAGGDVELETPEFPVTDDEGDRFPCGAPDHQGFVRWLKSFRRGKVPVSQQLRTVPPEHVAREHFRIECGLVLRDAGAHERRTRPADLLTQRSGHCSLSFSD